MHPAPRPWQTIGILALSQILSWGALYYAFSILAPQIGKELGWSAQLVYGAFSWSLLVAGLAATPVGVLLDRIGGRSVMGTGSLLSGLGLISLSQTHSVIAYVLSWTLLGLAMALTLYEAAFATIVRQFGAAGRRPIATLTLFAGFASTLFWPLTQLLNTQLGWRDTYMAYGAAQLAICLPLHLLLSNARTSPAATGATAGAAAVTAPSHTLKQALTHPAFWKLALAFATNRFIFSALSVHLIPMLQEFGHSAALAVGMAALFGPMQVAGRIGEMTLGKRARPQGTGKYVFSALPIALLTLILFGTQQWAVALFCLLYGLSNGILTILRGTLPVSLFGARHYGAIAGALAGPTLIANAAGPLAIAAIGARTSSSYPLLMTLLACAVLSLMFYLAAVRNAATNANPISI